MGQVKPLINLSESDAIKIANDANAAALAEAKFGAAKNKRNVIMLTLGTGVGGGIIANGKLIEGNMSAGAELGHSVIVKGGEPCTCGRCGCLEAYSSATALIRETKKAMKNINIATRIPGISFFFIMNTSLYNKSIIQ